MHNHQPTSSPGPRRKRAFLLVGGLVLLAALLVGYYAYWRMVAQQLEAGVAAWADEARAQGNDVAFAWDGIGGFPLRFAATFREPAIRWHERDGDVAWRGATLEADMAPWDLRTIRVRSDGRHTASLRLPGDPSEWHVSAAGFDGTIALRDNGALRSVAAALQEPGVAVPDGTTLAGRTGTIMADLPDAPPTDFRMPLARLVVDVKDMDLPAGTRLLTEGALNGIGFDATIKGPMPLGPLTEALAAWRDAGGVVELANFNVAQDSFALSGNGTVALDADLQPEGAGTITTAGLGEAVEILIADGRIPPDRALVARATVKALEKPGDDGRLQARLGLSLQNRVVSLGPVPLIALPRIAWP